MASIGNGRAAAMSHCVSVSVSVAKGCGWRPSSLMDGDDRRRRCFDAQASHGDDTTTCCGSSCPLSRRSWKRARSCELRGRAVGSHHAAVELTA